MRREQLRVEMFDDWKDIYLAVTKRNNIQMYRCWNLCQGFQGEKGVKRIKGIPNLLYHIVQEEKRISEWDWFLSVGRR